MTEGFIRSALERLLEGRTGVVIAHRLATVLRADVILVIQQGKLVEKGTHQELLSRGGLYAHLYETQFSVQQGPSANLPEPTGEEPEGSKIG